LVSAAVIGTSFCATSGAAAKHAAIAPKASLLVIFMLMDISHLESFFARRFAARRSR
jgi:hypothetical protein